MTLYVFCSFIVLLLVALPAVVYLVRRCYQRALNAASLNVETNLISVMTQVHRKYLLSAHATHIGSRSYVDASGSRIPVDEQFLREVEDHAGIASFQSDRFRLEVLLCASNCVEDAAHDPIPLQDAVRRYTCRRIRLQSLQSLGQMIRHALNTCWVQWRYTRRFANPITRSIRSVARQKAQCNWSATGGEL